MSQIAPLSFGGLGSGIDVQTMVDGLVLVSSGTKNRLQDKRSLNDKRLKVLDTVGSKLSDLEGKLSTLKRTSTAVQRTVSVPQNAGFAATATGGAADGAHAVLVTQLAASERQASQGLVDSDATSVGTGTLQVTVAGVATQIALVSGQDTLSGVRDAINAAGVGATASVVNTGTGATPYQLVITGDETGVDQVISIDASGLTGGAGLTFSQVRAAANAKVTVDGVALERSKNTISDVLDSITLDLVKVTAAEETFTVAVDTQKTVSQVQEFVDTYNALMDTVAEQFTVGTDGNRKPLSGDFTLRLVQSRLSSAMSGTFGRPGSSNPNLAAVGLTTEKGTFRLALDRTKLETALKDTPEEVLDLLVRSGQGPDSTVRVVTAGTTEPGAYDVTVTQAATRAEARGAQAIQAGGLAAAETLTFTFGGANTPVSLAAGDTISSVVTKINTALDAASVLVRARDDAGVLVLEGDEFGSAYSFSVASDQVGSTSAQTGIGTTLVNATGLDVAGSIGGDAATGSGLSLIGASSGATPGLVLQVFGTQLGSRGNVTVFGGFAAEIGSLVDTLTDPVDGALTLRKGTLNKEQELLDGRIVNETARLDRLRERLRRKFNAMDSAIAAMNAQLTFLTQSFGP